MQSIIAKQNFMHEGVVVHSGDELLVEDSTAKYLSTIGRIDFIDSGSKRDAEAVADTPAADVKKNHGRKPLRMTGENV